MGLIFELTYTTPDLYTQVSKFLNEKEYLQLIRMTYSTFDRSVLH